MSSEREFDEGIKSIKSAWRREHTARTNLKRMLEQAEAENAKLKELVQDIRKQIGDADRINVRLIGENESLKAENEKLRDLIADMSKAFFTLDIDRCQACPRDKASRRCQMFATTEWECAFVTEMRKLGIETDDD